MTRRLLPVLAAVALLVVADPARVPAQTGPPGGATIELVERPPWVSPVDEVTFLLATSGDVSAAAVQVEVFSTLDSAAELEDAATEDVGVRLSRSAPVPVGELPPGRDGTRAVSLRVSPEPVDGETVQLVEPGVHPVVISLLDAGGAEIDQIRTPLVRLADDADEQEAPDLAVLLDVAATPTLQPDGTRAIEPAELRGLSRIGDVLGAHPDLDLSVAAVPDTVDALGTLPDPAADELLGLLAERPLLSVPYLPVPLAPLIDQGVGGLVAPLVDRGEAVLADRLGASPDRSLWTDRSAIGSEGARLLDGLGFDSVVVDAAPDPDREDDDEPAPLADAGPRPLEGISGLQGLVVDPVLSEELASAAGDDVDAGHVALARLLLRPVEDPDGDDAATVLARPGELDADPVLARLLDLLDDPAAPVRVGGLDLVDAVIDGDAGAVDPPAGGPDVADAARRVLAGAGQLDSFERLIGTTSSRADDLRLQVATALATATPDDRRDAAVGVVEEALGSAFGNIRLSGQTDLNLTSRRGSLPVTVENANPFPVEVVVRTRSDRLAFPAGGHLPVTVGASDVLRIDVSVEALATGSVPVFVELWTPDDAIRLDTRRLNVRSTAISGVGLVLSLGALLVLVVWWVRNWRRTHAAKGAGAGRDPETTSEPMG